MPRFKDPPPEVDKPFMLVGSPRRILLVDTPLMCEYIKQALDLDGHDTETAHSAAHALEKLSSARYDVVFTGYRVTDMTGVDFARAVKRQDESQPVVLLTAIRPPGPPRELFKIVFKPIQLHELRETLLELQRALPPQKESLLP